ncbi:MAG: DUF677 domain-containing protein [Lachnospiraceae bacterium]|nr:DUF677 domain-containing protein [Lachnospiraceae bacterium]
MILNELSIRGNNMNREDIKQAISQLLKVCHKLFHEKDDKDFYYAGELLAETVESGYTIHDWLRDSEVPQKEKAFFRMILNRGHFIKEMDFPGSELFVEVNDGEKIRAVGCLAAYESESFVVSMNTSHLWQAEKIVGTYETIEQDGKQVSVENCCSEEQLHSLEEKEKNRVKLMISSGKELWEKRKILYPHLCFCDNVQKQLEEARISLHIQTVMKRLQLLEDYFKKFDGRFDKNEVGYGCRGESETVEKNDELRRLRVFRTPYGKEEFFGWHISFAGNFPGRIHFIPDAEHGLGIVGYIGKHLPTGNFSTI